MMHLMPTHNPRLTITLDPAIADCLRRLSEATGSSQSRLIAELLEGSVPVFERVIKTIELAKTASSEIRGKLASDMEEAQKRVESQMGFALDEFDSISKSLEPSKTVKRRARKVARVTDAAAPALAPTGAPGRFPTPMSNRGVRSTPTTEKINRRKAP